MPAASAVATAAPLLEEVDDLRKLRQRFDAVVEENRLVCREHYLLRLRIASAAFPATRPAMPRIAATPLPKSTRF